MARSVRYRVRLCVRGELDPEWWSAMFDELAADVMPDGTTLLSGTVPDQAALHGLMGAVRDTGLTLLSLESIGIAEPSAL